MDLHRIGIKVPMQDGAVVPALEFIHVFHRWIQERVLPGTLVDVADYSHVHHGPGVVLIAHELNYAVDDHEGRRGLSCYAKRTLEGDLTARLVTVTRQTLVACDLLEREARLGGRVRFDAGTLELFANDRLAAPNNADTEAAILPVLKPLLRKLYPGRDCRIEREAEPRARFTLRIDSGAGAAAAEVLERL
jgi:hypothetical protein